MATNLWSKTYYQKHRQKILEGRLRRLYGLSKQDYDDLLASQKGVCAICERARKYTLHIDHDHKTGAIRGLLCFQCNVYLDWYTRNYDAISRYIEVAHIAKKVAQEFKRETLHKN